MADQAQTAFELDDDQRRALREDLRAALGAEPVVTCELDAALLGGVVLHVGQRVYDASVAGRLRRLAESLKQRIDSESPAAARKAQAWP